MNLIFFLNFALIYCDHFCDYSSQHGREKQLFACRKLRARLENEKSKEANESDRQTNRTSQNNQFKGTKRRGLGV